MAQLGDATTTSNNAASLIQQFLNQYNGANTLDTNLANNITSGYNSFSPQYNVPQMLQQLGGMINVTGGIGQNQINQTGAVPYQGYSTMSQGLNPQFMNAYNSIMNQYQPTFQGYQNFAQTGGFTPGDIQALYAQGNAPNAGIMANLADNAARTQALSGGNISNMMAQQVAAAKAGAQQTSANAVQTAGNIASMTQQGKLAGLGGMASTTGANLSAMTSVQQLNQEMQAQGLAGMTQIEQNQLAAELQNAQINQAASEANLSAGLQRTGLNLGASETANNQILQSLAGQTQLYGAQPGATGLAGNQQLSALGQQINATQVPSNLNQILGNSSGVLGLLGQLMSSGNTNNQQGGGQSLLSKLMGGSPGVNQNSGQPQQPGSSINDPGTDINGIPNDLAGGPTYSSLPNVYNVPSSPMPGLGGPGYYPGVDESWLNPNTGNSYGSSDDSGWA
jgi:hypothetical protein